MERRYKMVLFDPQVIAEIMKDKMEFKVNDKTVTVESEIPLDAKMIGSGFGFNEQRGLFYIIMEHKSFNQVEDGQILPIATPIMTTVEG